MRDLHELSAGELASKIATKQISCEAVIESCCGRIAAREPLINAWEHIDLDRLLLEARRVDDAGPRPPLYGLPVGIKDIIDTHEMPTAYGSAIYAGHVPPSDAAVVALIKEAGGLIAGKTVTTEFATRHPGKTANPHNPDHTPGGSSSGSAAAVADFMVPLALGTQTTGSHIRPASYCGIVGFKPTYGTINRTGLKPLSDSLDTIGVYGRKVVDVALLAGVLMSRDFSNLSPCEETLKVGVYETPHEGLAREETRQAMEIVAGLLSSEGHNVKALRLDGPFQSIAHTQEAINNFESYRALSYERTNFICKLSDKLRNKLEISSEISWDEYFSELSTARECTLRLDNVFDDFDIFIAPSAPGEAPVGLQFTGDPIFSQIWHALQVPAISLPVADGPNGLPVGVQLIARRYADHRLLTAAQHLEQLIERS